MRFLHTADIHLKKGEEKRLDVFTWLLKRAGELEVDYFIVAGDLFDSDSDATLLRNEVRRLCESLKFKLLVIPGNHDAGSFGPEYEYGENVIQLTEKPFQLLQGKMLKICGVPYADCRFSDGMKDLPHDIDVLIAHGTLYDQSFIFSMLADQETKYMPIFPIDLENVARYVALGHLHSRWLELKYQRTHVVYSGSPVAIDLKCVGQRCFQLLKIDEKHIEMERHSVTIAPYWVDREFCVYPGAEGTVLQNIEEYLREVDDAMVMPNILVAGYVGGEEKGFLDQLAAMQNTHAVKFEDLRINAEIQSWDKLMTNPLIQNFVTRTAGFDDELRLKIFEVAFPVFSKVLK